VWAGLLLMLGIHGPGTVRAQNRPSAPDKTLLAVSRAQNEGRYLDAEKILRDAIGETQASDPNSPRLGDYLRRLAMIVGIRGDSSEAIALNQRAFEADRKALGPTDLRVANDLTSMASISLNQGRNQEAEQLYQQALDIAQLHLSHLETGRDVGGVAAVFAALAGFYTQAHRLAEAEAMLLQMKKLCDLLPPHPGVILVCDMAPAQLAQLYRSEGRAVEADQQPSFDRGTPAELAKLDRAAEKYEKDGLYAQAEVTYRQAIAWIEANRTLSTGIVLGTSFLTDRYNRLGGVFEKQGLNERAEAIYRDALELQEAPSSDKPGSIYYFNFTPLENFYRAHGRLNEIEPVIRKALEIQEKTVGEQSPRVVNVPRLIASFAQFWLCFLGSFLLSGSPWNRSRSSQEFRYS
jgi:tetratricopeptide (TPR) repeat protein